MEVRELTEKFMDGVLYDGQFIDRCHRKLTLTISLFGEAYCTHFTKL